MGVKKKSQSAFADRKRQVGGKKTECVEKGKRRETGTYEG